MTSHALHQPLFPLGKIVATRGALDLLDRTETDAMALAYRHCTGDWGTVRAEDASSNSEAISAATRVLSSYQLGQPAETLWIITETDRSTTCLLLPKEY